MDNSPFNQRGTGWWFSLFIPQKIYELCRWPYSHWELECTLGRQSFGLHLTVKTLGQQVNLALGTHQIRVFCTLLTSNWQPYVKNIKSEAAHSGHALILRRRPGLMRGIRPELKGHVRHLNLRLSNTAACHWRQHLSKFNSVNRSAMDGSWWRRGNTRVPVGKLNKTLPIFTRNYQK